MSNCVVHSVGQRGPNNDPSAPAQRPCGVKFRRDSGARDVRWHGQDRVKTRPKAERLKPMRSIDPDVAAAAASVTTKLNSARYGRPGIFVASGDGDRFAYDHPRRSVFGVEGAIVAGRANPAEFAQLHRMRKRLERECLLYQPRVQSAASPTRYERRPIGGNRPTRTMTAQLTAKSDYQPHNASRVPASCAYTPRGAGQFLELR
jgi:hypothetical protein